MLKEINNKANKGFNNKRDISRSDLAHMVTNLRKELKDQIEENKELLKINEEHQKINGELRKEIDGLVTVIDLVRNTIKEGLSQGGERETRDLVDGYDLLEILERVNEE